MSVPTPSKCRSCGALIYWAKTASGKSIPVNVLPVHRGNVLLTWSNRRRELMATVLAVPGDAQPWRNVYTSHFATCPQADAHRRGS